jgi:hypothetical protein
VVNTVLRNAQRIPPAQVTGKRADHGRVTVFTGSSRHSRRFCTPAADPDVIADERRAAP